MDSISQSCPSCKSSKYNNPQLRLMVNVCGHSLCETCVEVLFVRGSGLCFQCKTPIRKTNFRYQLFEDPEVQKEIDIRKKILNDFNKREMDFDTLEEYDLYLEIIEDIIYKLANDIEVDKTKKLVEQYKKDNKEIIKRNRTKQTESMEFYERELEKEQASREQREKMEEVDFTENRRKRHLHKTRMLQVFFGAEEIAADSENRNPDNHILAKPTPPKVSAIVQPQASSLIPTSASVSSMLDSKHRFLPPPPGSAFARPLSMMSMTVPPSTRWGGGTPMVPPSARWGGGSQIVPPSTSINAMITPASSFGMMVPPSAVGGGSGLTNWATSKDHHNVHIPQPSRIKTNLSQQDEVVFNRKTKLTISGAGTDQIVFTNRAAERKATAALLKEMLRPYKPELCGPEPPSATTCINKSRWTDLELVYHTTVIQRINSKALIPDNPNLDESIYHNDNANENGCEAIEASMVGDKPKRGLSADLPKGSCGIAPNVFLRRCLEDSRCGLFI